MQILVKLCTDLPNGMKYEWLNGFDRIRIGITELENNGFVRLRCMYCNGRYHEKCVKYAPTTCQETTMENDEFERFAHFKIALEALKCSV